jgi:twitching motility protein PilT
MSQAPPVPLLGRIALHLKLITMEQLSEATRQQGKSGGAKNLGAILIELGHLTEPQLQDVLRARQQVVARARAKQAIAEADPEPEVAPAPKPAPVQVEPEPPAAAPELESGSLFGDEDEPTPELETSPAPAMAPIEPDAIDLAPESEAAASPETAPAPVVTTGGGGDDLVSVLRRGVEQGASDIHIHAGSPMRLRLHGRFTAVDDQPVAPEVAERLVRSALNPEQMAQFDELGELDFAYSVPGLGRFRTNVFKQQHGIDGVFRSIPSEVPSLSELGLPNTLAKFTNYHQGLVLVTGPANCGKSSTLAAMVDLINEERREHILTVEDPIEYLQPSKRCVVNQRNVGPHTESFARALRGALREDPDVIVIGELRDLETISLALTAAETGHLVLGTLHTNSSIRTLNRIIGVFPADQQEQIRNMVSESLRAVVSQRLVPTADGTGRVPALEILVNNMAIGNLIRENKTFQIFSILQTGAAAGMCLLDESLNQLVADGTITKEDALFHCDDPKRIRG